MRSPKIFPWLKRAASLWAGVCAGYFLWEAVSYRGFFARLAELQMAKFGAYAPFLTYLVLVSCAVVPALLLVWILRPSADHYDANDGLGLARLAQAKRWRLVLSTLGLAAVTASVAFAVYPMLFLPSQNGQMQTIAISEVSAIPVKEGPARIVGGELGTVITVGQNWFIDDERLAFAPYRALTGSGGVARVFVELDATNGKALADLTQRPSWSGIIVEGGLPGSARSLFNAIGIGISSPYYTLYRTDYALRIGYWLQAAQWLVLAAVLGLAIILLSFRIRRISHAQLEGE